jgi:peroxiredoxin
MRADIVPGSKFPDYELPDHTGTRRRLSELQGKDPVALVLSRGSFCPREHRQHVWMVGMEPEVVLSYTRFITISPDPVMGCLEWRSKLGAHWPFLSDGDLVMQRDLGIAEYTDPDRHGTVPHTIMLEPGLVGYKIYVGYW